MGGYDRAMKKTSKELDQMAQRWLEEHKRKRSVCGEDDQDFMDVMLSTLDEAEFGMSSYDADTINKATSLACVPYCYFSLDLLFLICDFILFFTYIDFKF